MAQIIWADTAVIELNETAEYIALSNPTAAANLVSEVFAKLERLERFPRSGTRPLEIPELGYREVIVEPCRVFYRIDSSTIYIIHICRSERDLRKFLIQHGISD